MSRFDIEYVDSEDALSNACADLCRFGVIGIDTEFFRETTYYPIPALIQLYGEGKAYIVDCLAISHWEELAKLCRNQSVLKLLHSCGEDMEVFHRLIGTTPHPVVDTQLAAAIAGFDFSMGYQNLVKALFGEEVDKEQTRSNWLQRPLTEAQVRYAADDVVWLPKIWKALSGTLEEKGRLDWCLQDCEQLVQTPVPSLQSPDRAYLRLKAAWRLSGEDLHLLRAICAWRELEAQSRDVPRSRVLTDSAAIELSRRAPGSLAELRQIDQLKLNSRKGFADDVLMVIKKARLKSKQCPLHRFRPMVLRSWQANITCRRFIMPMGWRRLRCAILTYLAHDKTPNQPMRL